MGILDRVKVKESKHQKQKIKPNPAGSKLAKYFRKAVRRGPRGY